VSVTAGQATRVVAVDLGASSGRVYAVDIEDSGFSLQEVGRFPNGAVEVGGVLYWDVLRLYQGILDGLRVAGREWPVASIGIDSWAVDYGLLDPHGRLIGNPVSHRDPRSAAVAAELIETIGADELYGRTGVALHAFNTIFQLVTDIRDERLSGVGRALLIPDLLSYFLTGVEGTEETNASTTGLYEPSGQWDEELIGRVGIPRHLLAPIRAAGSPAGTVLPAITAELGISGPVAVTAVASHDTASAVAAVPAFDANFAYISCGTWSLVGLELDKVVVSAASRQAGFTNEAGIGGTVRFLRNVMGLWLHQQSVKTWERRGMTIGLGHLADEAARIRPLSYVIDPDDPRFLPPGDMPARIAAACTEDGQPVPTTPAEVTRCILDSLALAYRRSIRQAQELTGQRVDVVHIVGGGVNNRLLCQLTADACELPVVAGPVEAAAIGNGLVQAGAIGVIDPSRWEIRRRVAAQTELTSYLPDPASSQRFAVWADSHPL
jgi:rhamnulokinase